MSSQKRCKYIDFMAFMIGSYKNARIVKILWEIGCLERVACDRAVMLSDII